MKHEKRLAPGERWDVAATGRYIGYASGAGEIEVSVNGEPHLLDVRESLKAEEQYTGFSVRNMSDKTGDFVLKTGTGSLYMAGDGQLIRVTGIDETVNTEVLNTDEISAPIVSKIGALMASVLNIRQITETLKTQIVGTVDIRAITETLNIRTITETLKTQIVGTVTTTETAATSLATSQKTFTAGETYTIPTNANRRDITIMAAKTNTDLVTVGGVELAAGEQIEFKNYVGAVQCSSVSADKISITEVIK